MQSILYLVPTTLGENWATIPEEVKTIASNLDIFIVENLRSARRHLRQLGNKKDFDTEVSFYELDKHQPNIENLLNFINTHKSAGKNIGLLSEAGNPCIADPGAGAVELAHQLGLIVKPLVGPSSILMALIGSGFKHPVIPSDLRGLDYCDAKFKEAAGKALGEIKMPDQDRMIKLYNSTVRLIPPTHFYGDFFLSSSEVQPIRGV